jgi:hypothetical protein
MDETERAWLARAAPDMDVPMLMVWLEVQDLVASGLLQTAEGTGLTTHPGTFAELDKSRTRLYWPWN